MKNYIYILYVGLTVAFTSSCSSDLPTDGEINQRQVTVGVTADHTTETRATTPEITRYAISVWEDEVCTVAANVFASTNCATNATGKFEMVLNSTKNYWCLFWADNGTSCYSLGSGTLKDVTLAEGSEVSEAFRGKLPIPAGTLTTYSAVLKRAVAKITLKETDDMPAGNTMTVTLDQYTVFNVQSETVVGGKQPHAITWTTTAKSGTDALPVQLNDADIFVLAPVASANISNITFQCNAEGEIMVPNVPLQANYNTNIKGHYTTVSGQSFTVSYDGTWNGDKEP